MNTKLTLTIEQSVIAKAKLYAKEKGRSLSDIIENYLKSITAEQREINNTHLISKLPTFFVSLHHGKKS